MKFLTLPLTKNRERKRERAAKTIQSKTPENCPTSY